MAALEPLDPESPRGVQLAEKLSELFAEILINAEIRAAAAALEDSNAA